MRAFSYLEHNMKFTEEQKAWLRAALEGKTVQWRSVANEGIWHTATDFSQHASLLTMEKVEVRIKPDVIIVNGIEVPAPEKESFLQGESYYLACPSREEGWMQSRWRGDDEDKLLLRLQILHCSPEAAGAHGKAMRAHKPG